MAAKASVIKNKPNKLFHSPGDLFRQYFDKTTWKLRRTRIHQLKRENWQKRETEIEKNRQNWRNILLEEECNPDPRDEVIEFDEERNASLKFKKNYYQKKERTFNYIQLHCKRHWNLMSFFHQWIDSLICKLTMEAHYG